MSNYPTPTSRSLFCPLMLAVLTVDFAVTQVVQASWRAAAPTDALRWAILTSYAAMLVFGCSAQCRRVGVWLHWFAAVLLYVAIGAVASYGGDLARSAVPMVGPVLFLLVVVVAALASVFAFLAPALVVAGGLTAFEAIAKSAQVMCQDWRRPTKTFALMLLPTVVAVPLKSLLDTLHVPWPDANLLFVAFAGAVASLPAMLLACGLIPIALGQTPTAHEDYALRRISAIAVGGLCGAATHLALLSAVPVQARIFVTPTWIPLEIVLYFPVSPVNALIVALSAIFAAWMARNCLADGWSVFATGVVWGVTLFRLCYGTAAFRHPGLYLGAIAFYGLAATVGSQITKRVRWPSVAPYA